MMNPNRWAITALLIWTIVGVALVMLFDIFFEILWLGTVFIYVAFAFFGLFLIIAILDFAITERHLRIGFVILLFPVVGITLWFISTPLIDSGTVLIRSYRFERNLPEYERIVRELESDEQSVSSGTNAGIRFQIDYGPPFRVAFPQPGGLLDNWEGVIFDPTGEVLQAKGWSEQSGKQAFTAPDHIVRLFGGSIVTCVHIRGDFYRCWFT